MPKHPALALLPVLLCMLLLPSPAKAQEKAEPEAAPKAATDVKPEAEPKAATDAKAEPEAKPEDCIPIDSFASSKVGEFPEGWKFRNGDARRAYKVMEEGGKRFVRASADSIGQQAAKQFDQWNLDEYPMLAWSWRPVQFPTNADERESGRNDSALAVYLLVPYSQVRGPRAVKYIWSELAPVGTKLESNMGLTKVRVLRSGAEGKGTWTDEKVDVRKEYLAAFGLDAAPKPGGIAILTDSDDTGTLAIGDYADFRACKK